MTHVSHGWISRYDSLRVIDVYAARGDESPGLGLLEDADIRRLVRTKKYTRFSQTSSPSLHFTYNLNSAPLCIRTKPLAHLSSRARGYGKPP